VLSVRFWGRLTRDDAVAIRRRVAADRAFDRSYSDLIDFSGVAVVGGLACSQLVTLYVTPVFYTYLDELQQRLARRVGTPAREGGDAGTPVTA
jgi:hypothetical protein